MKPVGPRNIPNEPRVLMMASVRWYNATAHYALSLAQSLQESGVCVYFYGLPDSPVVMRARQAGIPMLNGAGPAGTMGYPLQMERLRKALRREAVNVIHAHMSRDHSLAWLASRGLGIPLVRTRSDIAPPGNNPLNRFFYRISAAAYTVPSHFMMPVMEGMGVGSRTRVIPLGIDYEDFADYVPRRDLRREWGIKPDAIVVSFIGRLHAVKGVEHLVRSGAYLRHKNDFHFVITGEEIDVRIADLLSLARSLGMENITIVPRTYDAREILSITDIGVIPSVASEAICRVALEMLSFGIPVVGSDINSIPEIIAPFGGLVVPPGEPEAIASALQALREGGLFRAMRQKIREMTKRCPRDRFCVEYREIYGKLLETTGS